MDFYKEKQRAIRMIDEMLKDGKDIEQIYFKVETCFGFSEKMVDKRVERMKNFIEGNKDATKERNKV